MFSARKRKKLGNVRKKENEASKAEEEDADPPISIVKRTKEKPKSGFLTFEEDNATENTPVSFKRQIQEPRKKQNKKGKFFNSDGATTEPTVGYSSGTSDYYSKERLEELKKNNMMYIPRTTPKQPEKHSGETAEPEIVDGEETIDKDTQEWYKQTKQDHVSNGGDKVFNTIQAEQMEVAQEEEDDEFKRWEIQQIKKGGAVKYANDETLRAKEAAAMRRQKLKQIPLERISTGGMVSVENIVQSIQKDLQQQKETLDRLHKDLSTNQHQIEQKEHEHQQLVKSHESNKENYVYFREKRDFVTDLLDFLGSKLSVVEDIEEKLLNLEIKKMERLELHSKDWQAWSDTEEEEEETHDKKKLLQQSSELLNDAMEEFSSIDSVKNHFNNWKFSHREEYEKAYVSLSMPAIFLPFVRLELIDWNPFTMDKPIENFQWYHKLFDYGINDDTNMDDESDADLRLVPALVEKVIVPKITKLATHIWNPRSLSQNKRAISIVKEVFIYIEPSSDLAREMLTAFLIGMQSTVESLPELQEEDSVLDRAMKLFVNVCQWNGVLSVNSLHRLALDQFLNSSLLPFLMKIKSVATQLKYLQQIVDGIPKKWFHATADTSSYTSLNLLTLHLQTLGTRCAESKDVNNVDKVCAMLHAMGRKHEANKVMGFKK